MNKIPPPSEIFRLTKKLYSFIKFKIRFCFKEKKFKKRLKYIFEDNGSDKLIIVFSGITKRVPKYNYIRTLKGAKIDKLFLLDDFGNRGSYHWYENGKDLPLVLTNGIIEKIKNRKQYKEVMTAGSSKGGTCALYFGLEHNVTAIFAGACQYYVGSYLNTPKGRDVLEGIMGINANEDDVKLLDSIMPNHLKKHAHSNSLVHLCYSKEEHTYKEHIKDLISDLELNEIQYVEQIDSYTDHMDNGIYYSRYLKKYFGITT